ncbi:MAG: PepSY-associated TM helix domain-containing protein [Planctomycetota bacterium]
MRWFHTYVSMLAFAALVFFSLTGLTLNHAEWFEGEPSESEVVVELSSEWASVDIEDGADLLQLVDRIRRDQSLAGAVEDVVAEPGYAEISFQGPGYAADVYIDQENGTYTVFQTRRGWFAVMNDLHKGRHTEDSWSWLIDVSSVVLTIAGATGLWLLFYLRKVRKSGLIVSAVGTLLLAAFAWLTI